MSLSCPDPRSVCRFGSSLSFVMSSSVSPDVSQCFRFPGSFQLRYGTHSSASSSGHHSKSSASTGSSLPGSTRRNATHGPICSAYQPESAAISRVRRGGEKKKKKIETVEMHDIGPICLAAQLRHYLSRTDQLASAAFVFPALLSPKYTAASCS